MINRKNRIKKKKDFEIIYKKSKIFKNNFLILRVLENNLEDCRFSVIISQKVNKKAVCRNKIRRRIYSIIKKNFNNLKIKADIVITIKIDIKDKSFKEVEEIIEKIFIKAKII